MAIWWRLDCSWAAVTAGRKSKAVLKRGSLKKVLIVCYGNIYRSPYAALLLRQLVAGACEVRSAGFHPVAGRSSPPPLVSIASTSGIDLCTHRSSIVTVNDLAWADTIVLMDRHNWQALRKLGADLRKLVWLGTLDGGCEIRDPYEKTEVELCRIMQRVHRCTEALAVIVTTVRNSTTS